MSTFSQIVPNEPAEQFVTITLENVAAQCDAVLDAVKPKRGNFYTVSILISAYCGMLVYRAYRARQLKREADIKKVEINSQVLIIEDRTFADVPGIIEPVTVPNFSLQSKRFIEQGQQDSDAESKMENEPTEEIEDPLPEPDANLINVH